MSKMNYENLNRLLGGKEHRRIEVEGYMPLVVEKLEGTPLVSLCHYGEQNGDLMRGPGSCFSSGSGRREACLLLQRLCRN